ncbi:unnamed protein product [Prunus armeniaca]|uniref:Uncharacterized protein n=1 Tax=Prunus armeniaca TaxID=36596 RepID=A0A6J5W597_PRUAR|nr:unnamed protein product [Prunus armeniaca]
MAPVFESAGDNNRLQEVSGLIKDAADEELNLKARIEGAEKLLAKTRQDKLELTEGIAQRVCDRSSTLLPRLKNLNWHETELGYFLARERKKMNILQLFLLGFANKAHQGKPIKPCLPGEEIAKHKLNFRMGHGTNSLAEEKQLLKQIIVSPKEINVSPKEGVGSFSSLENEYYVLSESSWWLIQRLYHTTQRKIVQYHLRQIHQLKWRRESLAVLLLRQWDELIANANADANAAAKGKIWDFLGSKKSLLEQIKKTGKEIDGLTELLLAVRQKIKQVEKELKVIEKDMESLQQKLQSMDQRKGEAHQCILKQRKQLLTKKKKTEKTTE